MQILTSETSADAQSRPVLLQRQQGAVAIQARLTVSQPGDPCELEADRVAEQVMRMPEPETQEEIASDEERAKPGPSAAIRTTSLIQRQAEPDEEADDAVQPAEGSVQTEDLIQRKAEPEKKRPLQKVIEQIQTGDGQPLPESTRTFFESRFGHDFSTVRIHTDSEAAQLAQSLHALAFTVGTDVVFGAGQYAPQTHEGRHLIAHELTHVVQQHASTQPSNGASGVQPDLAAPAAAVQRAPDESTFIEVELVEDAPTMKGRVKDIALDNFNTLHGILVNFNGALAIFGRVVDSSSKEEVVPKATSLIVLDEVGKFVFDKLVDHAISLAPKGDVVKDFMSLSKSVLEAIDKEQKRSAAATEENALKDFIVDLQAKITTATSNLLSSMQNDVVEVDEKYNQLTTEGEKAAFRRSLERENHRLTQMQQGSCSQAGLFTRIAEKWILGTTAPGKKYEARIVIKLNKSWKVFSAYVQAPRGSRIAEQLLRSGGGKVNLNIVDVPRFVEWFPLWDKGDWPLVRCEASLSASGTYSEIGATLLAKDYLQEFINLLGTKPLPETDKLTGHKTT